MEMAARGDAFKYSGASAANDPAWRVVIAIGPSRQVEAWVTLLGTLTVAVAIALPIHALSSAALAVAAVTASVRAARRHAWQEGAGGLRCLVVDLAGNLEVERADGTRVKGQVLDGSFVMPWLTIVRWRPDGARFSRTLLVAPDAVESDEFRRLRVLLRWR